MTTPKKPKKKKLTNLVLQSLRPDPIRYPNGRKVADEKGLYVFVTPKGTISWRYKYRFAGKERLLIIGLYPEISQEQARIERNKAEAILKEEGRDPGIEKRRKESETGNRVFEAVAREWFAFKLNERKKARKTFVPEYEADIIRSYEQHVFPEIGRLNVQDIESGHVIRMLGKISRAARADIIRRRLVYTFDWAAAHQLRPDSNPARIAAAVFTQQPDVVPMHALTTLPEIVALLQAVDKADAYAVHKLACRFIALTAARPGMVQGARWDELETANGRLVWTLPAARMKTRRDWTCPLSPAAVAVIDALRPVSGHLDFIFPRSTEPRLPMPAPAVVRLLASLGYGGIHVAHGFRSSFSTIMNEAHKGNADVAAIEVQLAHVTKGIAGIYNRALYIERRTELVDEWAGMIAAKLAQPAAIRDGRVANPLIRRRAA